MPFRIALVQKKACPGSPEQNLKTGLNCVAEAAAAGADIVLFPELWSIGYHLPFDFQPPETFLDAFCREARLKNIGIVITMLTAGKTRPRNSAFVIDKTGHILMRYDKVHTCDFSHEAALENGDDFYVCDFYGVQLGIMICYDREFPESARILMLKGAEIILVPNACPIPPARFNQLSTRAFENMTAVAMANYPAPQWGASCAFSPEVFDEKGESADNILFAASDTAEGVFTVDINLEKLRSWRRRETWGDAYRKVQTYGTLLQRAQPSGKNTAPVKYRPLKTGDYAAYKNLINEAWNTADYITQPAALDAALDAYMRLALLGATHATAACQNDRVLGILVARAKGSPRLSGLLATLTHAAFLALDGVKMLFCSASDRRNMLAYLSEGAHHKKLLHGKKHRYDCTIDFFVMAAQSRGLGIGKNLLALCFDYFKQQGARHVYLFTDTWCNYGFYDSQGFTRTATRNLPAEKGSTPRHKMFLYEKTLQ